jgi:hypothetical protein
MGDMFVMAKELLPGASVLAVIVTIVGYALAAYIKRRFDQIDKKSDLLEKRAEEIRATSLELKKDMRGEERGDLVTFRVAVEKWEDFLQRLVFDYTMAPPDKADIAGFYQEDNKLFLEVKIAVVKVGIYLRDPELERQLMGAVGKVRNTYYPLISATLPDLIDLQTQLAPIEIKRKNFANSGMTDMTYAPTAEDRDRAAALQSALTDATRTFSTQLLAQYRAVAEQLVGVKNAVNIYIYRPVTQAGLEKD